MRSKRRIHCWIVCVSESDTASLPPLRTNPRPRPVADPFIADLIAGLQAEVRQERRLKRAPSRSVGHDRLRGLRPDARAEAEITWRDSPLHFTETDFDAWERRSGRSGER